MAFLQNKRDFRVKRGKIFFQDSAAVKTNMKCLKQVTHLHDRFQFPLPILLFFLLIPPHVVPTQPIDLLVIDKMTRSDHLEDNNCVGRSTDKKGLPSIKVVTVKQKLFV